MKPRRIDRGLFSHDVSVAETADEIKAAWERVNVDALPEYLALVRKTALAVLKHHSLESAAGSPRGRQANWPRDVHMACDVLARLQLLEGRWPKEQWSDERRLVNDAMMLVQEYDELRVNLMYERDVRAREKQLAKFPNKPTVTDQQIRRALGIAHQNRGGAQARYLCETTLQAAGQARPIVTAYGVRDLVRCRSYSACGAQAIICPVRGISSLLGYNDNRRSS